MRSTILLLLSAIGMVFAIPHLALLLVVGAVVLDRHRLRQTSPLIALVVIAAASGSARAGTGVVVPPVEVTVAAGAPVGEAVALVGPSTEVLAGLHWGSLAWKPTWFDIGVGYTGSFRRLDRDVVAQRMGKRADDDLSIHGGYLHLAATIADERHWRTWFAVRGELMRTTAFDRTFSVLGGALRVATEVYRPFTKSSRSGFTAGTLAIGIFVEASYRDVPRELGPLSLHAGVSARLPFLVVGN